MLDQITSTVLDKITQENPFKGLAGPLTDMIASSEVRLSDGLLEDQLTAHLEELEELKDIAVYGYQDHLRIVAQVKMGSKWREALIKVTPERVIWGDQYQFTFQLELAELKSNESSSLWSFFKGLIQDRLWDLVPFGSIISKLSEVIVHRVFEQLGAAELQRSTGDLEWVSIEGTRVTVDLARLSHLSFLWSRPELGLPSVINDQLPRAIDCFKITEISARREGLSLRVEPHPMLKSLLAS